MTESVPGCFGDYLKPCCLNKCKTCPMKEECQATSELLKDE